MGLIGLTKKGDRRVRRTVHGFEAATKVDGSGWYRRRFPRGDDGSTIAWGQLIGTAPADTLLEALYVKLEFIDSGGGFAFIREDPENPLSPIVKAWPHNPALYSALRGSEAVPVRVFGERFTVERTEGEGEAEVTVVKECFRILGCPDKMASTPGHTATPDNGKGQALITNLGSHADTVDGGPCGGA